jgi:hypothetical protein
LQVFYFYKLFKKNKEQFVLSAKDAWFIGSSAEQKLKEKFNELANRLKIGM